MLIVAFIALNIYLSSCHTCNFGHVPTIKADITDVAMIIMFLIVEWEGGGGLSNRSSELL